MSKGGVKNEYNLTVKQEQYAKLLAAGGLTYTEAYKEVFKPKNCKIETIHNNASALANVDEVKARIKMLRKKAEEVFEEKQEMFANAIVEAAETAEIEEGKPDHSTRVKAAKTGLEFIIPKKQINRNENLNVEVVMTPDEVKQLLEGL